MIAPHDLQSGYLKALADRRNWENLWRECYDLALPNQSTLTGRKDASGMRRTDQIFDGTAMDGAGAICATAPPEPDGPGSCSVE